MSRFIGLVMVAILVPSSISCIKKVAGAEGYMVMKGDGNKGAGGRAGTLHPTIIEYILASEEAPFVLFYDVALATDGAGGDRAEVAAVAAEIAGAEDSSLLPVHYARARARQLAPRLNQELAKASDKRNGVVDILCCRSVDRERRVFTGKPDRPGVGMALMVNHVAKVARLQWNDMMTLRTLTWDLALVPNAYDPAAELDYQTVARTIRTMHPPQPRYYAQ